jgi:cell division septation protein DedD
MAAAGDTEITLGTGKMLLLFFGLVALCAVFFGMGFSLGKNSAKADTTELPAGSTAQSGPRPSASKNTGTTASSDPALKPMTQKVPDVQSAATSTAGAATQPASSASAASDAPPTLNGYFVQVAAVSKQEDAAALVDALKKKQYAAFSTNAAADKLYRVQVGPFGDIKDAEATRAKLVSDGYNPILKK